MKNYFNPKRLTIIADHLIGGKMHNKPYTIQDEPIFISYDDGSFDYMEPFFKYVLHELPHIFAEDWYETADGEPLWTMDEEKTIISSLQGFFGIDEAAIMHILIPGRQNIERYGGKTLLKTSTHIDIAINIMEMIGKITSRGIAESKPIYLN